MVLFVVSEFCRLSYYVEAQANFVSCLKTNWFPSVLWHCWFGHVTCKNRPRNDL